MPTSCISLGKKINTQMVFLRKMLPQKKKKKETPKAFLPSKVKSLEAPEAHSCWECNSVFNSTQAVFRIARAIGQGMARTFWPTCQVAV